VGSKQKKKTAASSLTTLVIQNNPCYHLRSYFFVWACYMKQQASTAAVAPTTHSNHKQISYQVAQAAREKAQED
jgi:hypothetical protein